VGHAQRSHLLGTLDLYTYTVALYGDGADERGRLALHGGSRGMGAPLSQPDAG
jgi:hypothetical protein